MFFTGMTFCGGKYSLDYTPTNVSNIINVTIKNGIYDSLYLSKGTNKTYSTSIPDWDFDTLLYASFENNLLGGNIDYTISSISSIKIKRRIKNTFDWMTFYEIPVSSENDIKFDRFDFYNQSHTEYDYAIISVINGVEGNESINSVLSEFEGLYIIEKDKIFKTTLEVEIQQQRNKQTSVVNTLDRKYPYVISNSKNNYYSGSVSGVFMKQNTLTEEFEPSDSWNYRYEFMDFLQDGIPKILKSDDGRMWLVMIVDNPSEQPDSHPEKIKTSFNFVEVGDYKSKYDLYDNNFIDFDV